MKLTRGKLLETIRRKNEGWTTYQAHKIGGVSVRRVNQVMREYERLQGKLKHFTLCIDKIELLGNYLEESDAKEEIVLG